MNLLIFLPFVINLLAANLPGVEISQDRKPMFCGRLERTDDGCRNEWASHRSLHEEFAPLYRKEIICTVVHPGSRCGIMRDDFILSYVVDDQGTKWIVSPRYISGLSAGVANPSPSSYPSPLSIPSLRSLLSLAWSRNQEFWSCRVIAVDGKIVPQHRIAENRVSF